MGERFVSIVCVEIREDSLGERIFTYQAAQCPFGIFFKRDVSSLLRRASTDPITSTIPRERVPVGEEVGVASSFKGGIAIAEYLS